MELFQQFRILCRSRCLDIRQIIHDLQSELQSRNGELSADHRAISRSVLSRPWALVR